MSRYECDRCGACCRTLIVEVTELDVLREPRIALAMVPFRQEPGFEADEVGMLACGGRHPCPFVKGDNLCEIYPTRPNCCMAFDAGSEQCQDARRMAGLPPLPEKGAAP